MSTTTTTTRTISMYPEDWLIVEGFCQQNGLHTAKGPNYSAAIRAIIRQIAPKPPAQAQDKNQLRLFNQDS